MVASDLQKGKEQVNGMDGINGIRAIGRKEFERHRSGGRLTQRQAIIARCFDCCGGYVDGKVDCKLTECPLYPFMPYREQNDPVFASGT